MFGKPSHARAGLTALLLSFGILVGCTSPQQLAKERQANMEKLVTTAIQHLLDRNPTTIQDSMNLLTRDEMTQPLVEKLQNDKVIPETDLSILKLKDDSERAHSSNQVVVEVIQPMDETSKPDVRFRVTGKDITQIDGKPAAQKPFEFVATCRLTGDMDGFPRITALEGATASKASEASAAPRKKKRRHR